MLFKPPPLVDTPPPRHAPAVPGLCRAPPTSGVNTCMASGHTLQYTEDKFKPRWS